MITKIILWTFGVCFVLAVIVFGFAAWMLSGKDPGNFFALSLLNRSLAAEYLPSSDPWEVAAWDRATIKVWSNGCATTDEIQDPPVCAPFIPAGSFKKCRAIDEVDFDYCEAIGMSPSLFREARVYGIISAFVRDPCRFLDEPRLILSRASAPAEYDSTHQQSNLNDQDRMRRVLRCDAEQHAKVLLLVFLDDGVLVRFRSQEEPSD